MSSTEISLRWQTIVRKLKNFPRLKTFFYFFELETGCGIIALFETLVSVMQICSIYHLASQSRPSVILPDPFWITKIERDGIINRMFLYHTNHHFLMALCLVTVLNSMLLIIGCNFFYFEKLSNFEVSPSSLVSFLFSQVMAVHKRVSTPRDIGGGFRFQFSDSDSNSNLDAECVVGGWWLQVRVRVLLRLHRHKGHEITKCKASRASSSR